MVHAGTDPNDQSRLTRVYFARNVASICKSADIQIHVWCGGAVVDDRIVANRVYRCTGFDGRAEAICIGYH